ncbi:hypothetical protein AURDEDRAFT_57017 [Auricularia subglabra TFB-10046 SS5]|nr:hypothetical protein AURDEDRAFT_57017 [Auricularia subglabra TFB-10046 SS5]
MVQCYYCTHDVPQEQAKRCARCRLVTYCSKECQVTSWKSSHKRNCRPHPSVLLPNGEIRKDKPAKGTEERRSLDVDMCLSHWMARWRNVFQLSATVALDLPNHPPERVLTHCMFLIVEPRDTDLSKCKRYRLAGASLVSTEEMDEMFPELGGIVTDPGDLMALRFVLALRDPSGELIAVRRVQWSVRNMEVYRRPSKVDRSLWSEMLREAIENHEPETLGSHGELDDDE